MTPDEAFERADAAGAKIRYPHPARTRVIRGGTAVRIRGNGAAMGTRRQGGYRAGPGTATGTRPPCSFRRPAPRRLPRPGRPATGRTRIGGKHMNDTQSTAENPAAPADPAMAAADPAMFTPMTGDENHILRAHLTSGWYKQSAVYPVLSEPWRETSALLDDLSGAWRAAWQAGHGEPEAPEAGS